MHNKYVQLQIDCDFSVHIQILQLQVLKTFATIIPSYYWTVLQSYNLLLQPRRNWRNTCRAVATANTALRRLLMNIDECSLCVRAEPAVG